MSWDLLRIKGRTKGRKCPGKGNKQHESGCCSSYEKGVSGKGSHVQKTGGKVNGILCPLQIHLFLKSLLSNNFMRGNRSAEQANEMCVIGHHRKESTATQGHPFSIHRVHVVLFLLLEKVKSSVQWSQISDEWDL